MLIRGLSIKLWESQSFREWEKLLAGGQRRRPCVWVTADACRPHVCGGAGPSDDHARFTAGPQTWPRRKTLFSPFFRIIAQYFQASKLSITTGEGGGVLVWSIYSATSQFFCTPDTATQAPPFGLWLARTASLPDLNSTSDQFRLQIAGTIFSVIFYWKLFYRVQKSKGSKNASWFGPE